jgi:hypothetical protein
VGARDPVGACEGDAVGACEGGGGEDGETVSEWNLAAPLSLSAPMNM